MPNAQGALALLRSHPVEACESYGFAVEYAPEIVTAFQGGQCRITPSHLNDSVFRLRAEPGVGDYFFPYTTGSLSATRTGRCEVPFGLPNGTIVLTSGMNGCSLQVNKHDGYFMFYHDKNGNQLQHEPYTGAPVCRVDWRSYDFLGLGAFWAGQQFENRPGFTRSAEFFQSLITVKHGGRWLVVTTGILRIETRRDRLLFGPSVTQEYGRYISTPTQWITSFDED